MKFQIDHDMHIHSQLSSCSRDPEQSTEAILAYGERLGMKTLCLTDHYWDEAVEGASDWYRPQGFSHVSSSLPLPQGENCRFLFGCETDMDRFGRLGIPRERYGDFDFIIVPTTHMHMEGFTRAAEDSDVPARARLFVERFERFLSYDLPFHKVGLAHLTCPLIYRENGLYLEVLKSIPDAALERLFGGCAELGCGIELNMPLTQVTDPALAEISLRPYRIAKAMGCRFYLGSDAHHPSALASAPERFSAVVAALGLTEADKFTL